jgi:ribosomal-protein-serine acetyltransferase
MFARQVGADLELRLLEEQHASVIFAAVDRNREYLRRWLPWVDPTQSVEDTLEFIRGAQERYETLGEIAAGIWYKSEFAGTIGTHKLDRIHRSVEIGYWLAQGLQGRGIVTDACRVMIRHAFVELGLNRLVIRCAVGNVKSCAVASRLGFTFEGTQRQAELVNGQFHDLNVWSMLRHEWNGQ